MLETHDLVKHYLVGQEAIRAVDGVSLSIAAGEFVSLYGPSGSGKSTLIDLIAGFQAPDRGTVLVDGRDISQLSENEHASYLLRVLGIVGDPHELMPAALAWENAALKLLRDHPRDAKPLIEPLLVELGLGERMRQPTYKLSMGERQRVMIAQALSMSPRLVLADEPTGNLDTRRGREVLGPIEKPLPRARGGGAARHARPAGPLLRRARARTQRRAPAGVRPRRALPARRRAARRAVTR